MFDIGWQELFVIAVIGLIVIGPKDLPRAMRTIAKWVRKARSLAREFQNGVDEMVREADLDDLKQEMKTTIDYDITKDIENSIDPTGDMKAGLEMPDIEKNLDEAGRAEASPSSAKKTGAAGESSAEAGPEEGKADDGGDAAGSAASDVPTAADETPVPPTPAKASG